MVNAFMIFAVAVATAIGITVIANKGRNSGVRWFPGILAVSLLATSALALPVQATQSTAANFSSCDRLLSQYPDGVAQSKAAANKAVRNGFAKPDVSASLYRTNASRLDRDRDGVMCEQPRSGGNSQSQTTPYNETRDYCEGQATIDLWNVPASCNAVLREVPSIQNWCRGAKVMYSSLPVFCNRSGY